MSRIPIKIDGATEFENVLIKIIPTETGNAFLVSEKYIVTRVKQVGKKVLNVERRPKQILIPTIEAAVDYLEEIANDVRNNGGVRKLARQGLRVLSGG